jgi:hypothetical protein
MAAPLSLARLRVFAFWQWWHVFRFLSRYRPPVYRTPGEAGSSANSAPGTGGLGGRRSGVSAHAAWRNRMALLGRPPDEAVSFAAADSTMGRDEHHRRGCRQKHAFVRTRMPRRPSQPEVRQL